MLLAPWNLSRVEHPGMCLEFNTTGLGGGKWRHWVRTAAYRRAALDFYAAGLPVQEDIQEGTMNVQAAVVLDEAELPELVHEATDPGPSGADHLRQDLLADLRNHGLGFPFLAEVGQQQQHPSQPLLARVEQLIDQVFLESHIAGQQVRHELLGEYRPLVEQRNHGLPVDSDDRRLRHRRRGRHTKGLAGERPLAKEVATAEQRH